MLTAQAIANEFLALAKEESRALTNMQVQKLVFLAQGYCLAFLDEPLFSEEVQAWEWGPVIPTLYQSLRQYGSGCVTDPISSAGYPVVDPQKRSLIEAVWRAYRGFSGIDLSILTHQEGSPWSKVKQTSGNGKGVVIPKELIQSFYKNELERTERLRAQENAQGH